MAKKTSANTRYCYECSNGKPFGSLSSRYIGIDGKGLYILVRCVGGCYRSLGNACERFEETYKIDPRLLTWDIVERVHGRKMR